MTLNEKTSTPAVLKRLPVDDDELWWTTLVLWGTAIPRHSVCPNHCAPFEAFANAFFARSPVAIWKASRGFGGKTNTLALLSLDEAVLLGAQSTILGGSSAQSLRVHEACIEAWSHDASPSHLLSTEPTKFTTSFTNGAWIRTLMASQTSVRGPHPQRLRLDEIDEMEMEILEAAQGQPMARKGIPAQTVMSSTHQYPDKTMTAIIKRAQEKNWPVFEWCYRETSNPIDGWLTKEMIDQKRDEVSSAMWATEYDLQEPSFEGRAIDTDSIDRAFDKTLGNFEGNAGEVCCIETPIEHPGPKHKWPYVVAVDWANRKDWTVITVFRTNENPWKCVFYKRIGRLPWPVMVAEAERVAKDYGGTMIHDATGLGDVVKDLLEARKGITHKVISQGKERYNLLSEYVAALEAGDLVFPFIKYMYQEHKYVTLDDLYGKGHCPDTIVVAALAWSTRPRSNLKNIPTPIVINKRSIWFR